MSTSYCQRVCQEVAIVFARVFANELRMPTREDALHSAAQFKERFGFDGCCYAIDGTHIRLRCCTSCSLHRVVSFVTALVECEPPLLTVFAITRCPTVFSCLTSVTGRLRTLKKRIGASNSSTASTFTLWWTTSAVQFISSRTAVILC
jgi:hypothetical protein